MEEKEHVHTEHEVHAKKHIIKRHTTWIWVSAVLALLLIISIWSSGFKSFGSGALSGEEASAKALEYINTNLVTPDSPVTISDKGIAKQEAYVFNIMFQGREFPVAITSDGKTLYPQGIAVDETAETAGSGATAAAVEYPKSDKPSVLMFVMSFCPYGQQAETGLKPAIELLNKNIAFEPHFVVYSNYASGYPDYCIDKENKYCSMHGIKELNEDVRQMCIWKNDKDNFWAYVAGINSECSSQNVDTCWEGVATKNKISVATIKTCAEKEALTLLAKEAELNAKYKVQGSPTVLINEQDYSGGRTAENFKTGICSAFNEAPADCTTTLSAGAATTAATGGCG